MGNAHSHRIGNVIHEDFNESFCDIGFDITAQRLPNELSNSHLMLNFKDGHKQRSRKGGDFKTV